MPSEEHRPRGGKTSLMAACEQGRTLEAKIILQKKPLAAAARDRGGKTALHYCAESGSAACAQLVAAADASLLNVVDADGFAPLHLAVIAANRAVARLLLKTGANPDCLDKERHSAVHWAAVCGDVESVELLLEHGADPSLPDVLGATPAHYAAQMCGPHALNGKEPETGVRTLQALVRRGAALRARDRDSREPLLWAASTGSSEAVLILFAAGSNVASTDKDGLTALHCASSRGHTSCVETLVTLCGSRVDAGDAIGCSPLFYAAAQGHADAAQVLLKYGADPNHQDHKGRTPAHCAAAKGQWEIVRILDSNGADLWLRNSRGNLPLHEAVQSGRKDLVQWLLQQCPKAVNATNITGRTPLHIAAQKNNVEMCEVLIDYGAHLNPLMVNAKGFLMSPLDASVYQGNQRCAKYLQLHGAVPATKVLENNDINRNLLFSLGNYAYNQKERSDEEPVSAASFAPAPRGPGAEEEEEEAAPRRDAQTRTIRADPLPPPEVPPESLLTNVMAEESQDASVHIHLSRDDLWSLWESLMQELTSELSEDKEGSEISSEGKVRQLKPILTNVYLRTSSTRSRDEIAGESILDKGRESEEEERGKNAKTEGSTRRRHHRTVREDLKTTLPKVSEVESLPNYDWDEAHRSSHADLEDPSPASDSVGSDTEHRSAGGVKVTRLRKRRSDTWAREPEESETSSGHRGPRDGNPYLKRYFQKQARATEGYKHVVQESYDDLHKHRHQEKSSERHGDGHKRKHRRKSLRDDSYERDEKDHRRKSLRDDSYERDEKDHRRKSLRDDSYERDEKDHRRKSLRDDSYERDEKDHRRKSLRDDSYEKDEKDYRRKSLRDDSYEKDEKDHRRKSLRDDSYERDEKDQRRNSLRDDSYEREDNRRRDRRDDHRHHKKTKCDCRSRRDESKRFLEVPLQRNQNDTSEERSGDVEEHRHYHHHHHHHHHHRPPLRKDASLHEDHLNQHRRNRRHYHRKRLRRRHFSDGECQDRVLHSSLEEQRSKSEMSIQMARQHLLHTPVLGTPPIYVTDTDEDNARQVVADDSVDDSLNVETRQTEANVMPSQKPDEERAILDINVTSTKVIVESNSAKPHVTTKHQKKEADPPSPRAKTQGKEISPKSKGSRAGSSVRGDGKTSQSKAVRRDGSRSPVRKEGKPSSESKGRSPKRLDKGRGPSVLRESMGTKKASPQRAMRKTPPKSLKPAHSSPDLLNNSSKEESGGTKPKCQSASIEKGSAALPEIKLHSVEGDTTDLLAKEPEERGKSRGLSQKSRTERAKTKTSDEKTENGVGESDEDKKSPLLEPKQKNVGRSKAKATMDEKEYDANIEEIGDHCEEPSDSSLEAKFEDRSRSSDSKRGPSSGLTSVSKREDTNTKDDKTDITRGKDVNEDGDSENNNKSRGHASGYGHEDGHEHYEHEQMKDSEDGKNDIEFNDESRSKEMEEHFEKDELLASNEKMHKQIHDSKNVSEQSENVLPKSGRGNQTLPSSMNELSNDERAEENTENEENHPVKLSVNSSKDKSDDRYPQKTEKEGHDKNKSMKNRSSKLSDLQEGSERDETQYSRVAEKSGLRKSASTMNGEDINEAIHQTLEGNDTREFDENAMQIQGNVSNADERKVKEKDDGTEISDEDGNSEEQMKEDMVPHFSIPDTVNNLSGDETTSEAETKFSDESDGSQPQPDITELLLGNEASRHKMSEDEKNLESSNYNVLSEMVGYEESKQLLEHEQEGEFEASSKNAVGNEEYESPDENDQYLPRDRKKMDISSSNIEENKKKSPGLLEEETYENGDRENVEDEEKENSVKKSKDFLGISSVASSTNDVALKENSEEKVFLGHSSKEFYAVETTDQNTQTKNEKSEFVAEKKNLPIDASKQEQEKTSRDMSCQTIPFNHSQSKPEVSQKENLWEEDPSNQKVDRGTEIHRSISVQTGKGTVSHRKAFSKSGIPLKTIAVQTEPPKPKHDKKLKVETDQNYLLRSPERHNPSAIFYNIKPAETSTTNKPESEPKKHNRGALFYKATSIPERATDHPKSRPIIRNEPPPSIPQKNSEKTKPESRSTARSTMRDRSLESEKAVAVANTAFRKLNSNGELTVFNSSIITPSLDSQQSSVPTLENALKPSCQRRGEYPSLEKPGFLWVHFGSGSSPIHTLKRKPKFSNRQKPKPENTEPREGNKSKEPNKTGKANKENTANRKPVSRRESIAMKAEQLSSQNSKCERDHACRRKPSLAESTSGPALNVSSKVLTSKNNNKVTKDAHEKKNDSFSTSQRNTNDTRLNSVKETGSKNKSPIKESDRSKATPSKSKPPNKITHPGVPNFKAQPEKDSPKRTQSFLEKSKKKTSQTPSKSVPKKSEDLSPRKDPKETNLSLDKSAKNVPQTPRKVNSNKSEEFSEQKLEDHPSEMDDIKNDPHEKQDDHKDSNPTPRLSETAKSSSLDEGDVRLVIERKADPDFSIKIRMKDRNQSRDKNRSVDATDLSSAQGESDQSYVKDSGYISTSESVYQHRRSITIDLGHTTAKINAGMKGTETLSDLKEHPFQLPSVGGNTITQNVNTHNIPPKETPSKLPILEGSRHRSNSLVFMDYHRSPRRGSVTASEISMDSDASGPSNLHHERKSGIPKSSLLLGEKDNKQRQVAPATGKKKNTQKRSSIPIYKAHSDGSLNVLKSTPRLNKHSLSTPSIIEVPKKKTMTPGRKMSSIKESSSPNEMYHNHSDTEIHLKSADKLRLPSILLYEPDDGNISDQTSKPEKFPRILNSNYHSDDQLKGQGSPRSSSNHLTLPLLQQPLRCRCTIQPHRYWDSRRTRSAVDCVAKVHFLSQEELSAFDSAFPRPPLTADHKKWSEDSVKYRAIRTQTLKHLDSARASADKAVTFHVDHARERNTFKLPTEKLEKNKKWQVVFTIGKSKEKREKRENDK